MPYYTSYTIEEANQGGFKIEGTYQHSDGFGESTDFIAIAKERKELAEFFHPTSTHLNRLDVDQFCRELGELLRSIHEDSSAPTIKTIILIRQATGASLKECKDAFDAYVKAQLKCVHSEAHSNEPESPGDILNNALKQG